MMSVLVVVLDRDDSLPGWKMDEWRRQSPGGLHVPATQKRPRTKDDDEDEKD
jgi:hypothetical protein